MQFNIIPSFVQTEVLPNDRVQNDDTGETFQTEYIISAGSLFQGVVFFISAGGVYGTALTPVSRTFDKPFLNNRLGGQAVILGVGSFMPLSFGELDSRTPNGIGIDEANWTFSGRLTVSFVRTDNNPSASLEGHGIWTFVDNTLPNTNDQVWASAITDGSIANTALDNSLGLGVKYRTADPRNYIEMRHFVVYAGV